MLDLSPIGAPRLTRRGDHRSSVTNGYRRANGECACKSKISQAFLREEGGPRSGGRSLRNYGIAPTKQTANLFLHALSFRHFLAEMPPPSRREAKETFATKVQQTHTAAHHFMRRYAFVLGTSSSRCGSFIVLAPLRYAVPYRIWWELLFCQRTNEKLITPNYGTGQKHSCSRQTNP